MTGARGVWGRPLTFVDVETTGASAAGSRVLEIGAVRVENGVTVAKLSSLVDPRQPVPEWITGLTGISDRDVAGAPPFAGIAPEVVRLMDGAVFVAHNVWFDYSFVGMEFGRLGLAFTPPALCTVVMSRRLFPQYRHHRLADLIDRHGLRAANRHRAYDDALCLWQWFGLCLAEFDLDTVESAMRAQLDRRA